MMIADPQLHKDTQSALLLCGYFSRQRKSDVKPLSLTEYNVVASWLKGQDMRPADLLSQEGQESLQVWRDQKVSLERLQELLGRGVALGFAVEKWTSQGIWVISRGDPRYPQKLKERLRSRAPVLLYGVGNIELLNLGGLAVVGSRNADEAALLFTNTLAERCAKERIPIISGDAKGVDREAMMTALDTGGPVLGLLPEGVAKTSLRRDYRQPLQMGNLVLISVVYPDAPWTAANAMSRNKYIYTLSDYACVVASAMSGGTWAGATENLKHGWVKLFVRSDPSMPEGNQALLGQGGLPLVNADLQTHVPLRDRFSGAPTTPLFEKAPTISGETVPSETVSNKLEEQQLQDRSFEHSAPDNESSAQDLFEVVWPYVARALYEPKTPADLADLFNVQKAQMNKWLKRAAQEHYIKKLAKPVRYVLDSQRSLPF